MPEFPVILKKLSGEVRIYEPSRSKKRYRVVYKVGLKRFDRVFPTYEEAKRESEAILLKLGTQGGYSLQLSNREAREYLDLKLKASKRGVSAIDAIHDWFDATDFLDDPGDLVSAARAFGQKTQTQSLSLEKAVDAYLCAKSTQLAERTSQQIRLTLARFKESLICQMGDLTRSCIRNYIQSLRNKRNAKPLGPKARNHHRTYIKGFLKWSAREMLITDTHWLDLSKALENEKARNVKPIHIHTPQELEKLLEHATGELRVLMGIGAFSGLRTAELLRLDWNDIKDRYVEVRAENAKTRARRLVPVCDALGAILKEFRNVSGPVWSSSPSGFRDSAARLYREVKVTKHPNALRHSFISYRLALTGDEKSTALEAGNTPDMIFQHYRELVTKEEAKQWFQIK